MASQSMLQAYTRMITDSHIKVRVEGKQAYATKDEIVIPALPLDSERAMIYGTGYAMHEGGHKIDTDLENWPQTQPLAKVTNWFEDVRIESKQIARYPGARKRLTELVFHLVQDGFFERPTAKDSPAMLVSAYMLYRMRSEILGQLALEDYAKEAEKLCQAVIPKNAMVRLDIMMYRIEEATCTADSIALATAVLDMLKEEQEKAEQEAQQQQQQGQANEPPDATQTASSTDPHGAGEEENAEPGQGGQGASPEASGAADPEQGQGSAGQATSAPEQSDPSSQSGATAGKEEENTSAQQKAENLRRITSGEDNEGMGDLGQVLESALNQMSKEAGASSVGMPEVGNVSHTLGEATKITERVNDATKALKRRVLNLLEGIDRDKRINTTSGPRLDMGRLHRSAVGNIRVFQKRIDGVQMNTAVQVLIDRSSSMGDGNRIATAIEAALALAFTLEHVKSMKSSVATFPYIVNGDNHGVGILSEFGERVAPAAGKFAALRACGWTPMAEALFGCGLRLSARKEDRKILFVMTDGLPEDGIHPSAHCIANTKAMISELEKTGIEVLAIGIGIDVSSLFRQAEMISDLKTLPNAVFKMLQSKLLHKKVA